MKKSTYFLCGIILFLVSCNSNKEYLEKIKEKINSDAMGFDLKYRSIDFQFRDTIYIKDIKDSLLLVINRTLAPLQRDSDFIIDLDTPVRLKKIKEKIINKEKILDKFYSLEGKSYHQMDIVVKELLVTIDSICANFSIKSNQYFILKTVIKYRENQATRLKLYDIASSYNKLKEEIDKAEINNKTIDSLSAFSEIKPAYYKAYNKYTINNPLFGGTKQTLESVFVFDESKNLIERIDKDNFNIKELFK